MGIVNFRCCEDCSEEDSEPCCNKGDGRCDVFEEDKDNSLCVHCGAEMIEISGYWYHHSQLYDLKEFNSKHHHGMI